MDDDRDIEFERIEDYNELLTHMEEIARALGVYRSKLQQDYDFTRDEAVMFCLDWHKAYWTGHHNPTMTIIGHDENKQHEDEDGDD